MIKIKFFLVFFSFVNLIFSQNLASKIVNHKMKPSIFKENNLKVENIIKDYMLTNMNFGGVVAGANVKSVKSYYKIVLDKPSDKSQIRYKVSFFDSSKSSKNELGFIFEYPSMKLEQINNFGNNSFIQMRKKRDFDYKTLGLSIRLEKNPNITITNNIVISGNIIGEIIDFSTANIGKISRNIPAGDMIGNLKMKIKVDVVK